MRMDKDGAEGQGQEAAFLPPFYLPSVSRLIKCIVPKRSCVLQDADSFSFRTETLFLERRFYVFKR